MFVVPSFVVPIPQTYKYLGNNTYLYLLTYYIYLLTYYIYLLTYYTYLLAYYTYLLTDYTYLLTYYTYLLTYYTYLIKPTNTVVIIPSYTNMVYLLHLPIY